MMNQEEFNNYCKTFNYYCALGEQLGYKVLLAETEIETINGYDEMVPEEKKETYKWFLRLGQSMFGYVIVMPIEQ